MTNPCYFGSKWASGLVFVLICYFTLLIDKKYNRVFWSTWTWCQLSPSRRKGNFVCFSRVTQKNQIFMNYKRFAFLILHCSSHPARYELVFNIFEEFFRLFLMSYLKFQNFKHIYKFYYFIQLKTCEKQKKIVCHTSTSPLKNIERTRKSAKKS
jgi:hypothetical protein